MASEADILNDDFRIAESIPSVHRAAQSRDGADRAVERGNRPGGEGRHGRLLGVRARIRGIDPRSWIPWGRIGHLPSEEQLDAGASWMRCDAVFPTAWDFFSVRTSTSSAAGVADNPPVAWMACSDEHPSVTTQPFVPCDRPHLYEQTGMLAVIPDVSTYPSPAQLRAEEDQCLERVTEQEQAAGVGITVMWDPQEEFKSGADISEPASRTARTEHRCRREARATTYWWAPWDSNPQPRD